MTEKRNNTQSGKGALGTIVPLAVFAAFAMALWNVGPIYISDYTLGDKMMEICRLNRGMNPDERIKELLMGVVRDERIDEIQKEAFKIQTRDNSRRITLEYDRTVKVLPGWIRTFHFSHDVDQPFF